jgi:hypothetical protein
MFNLISDDDPVTLAAFSAIILAVGSNIATDPALRLWGKRAAAAAYVLFSVYALCTTKGIDAGELLHIAFRGLFAAAIALGTTWIVLPILAFIVRFLLNFGRDHFAALESEANRREEKERHRISSDEAQRRQAQQEAEQRADKARQTLTQTESQRRRNDARAKAVLTFSRYASKLGGRFTQENLDHFVAAYMGDDQPPDAVERRAAELLQVLQEHAAAADPPEEKQTLDALARWFLAQKEHIQSLPLDDRAKRLHIVELTRRYNELSARLVEKLQP